MWSSCPANSEEEKILDAKQSPPECSHLDGTSLHGTVLYAAVRPRMTCPTCKQPEVLSSFPPESWLISHKALGLCSLLPHPPQTSAALEVLVQCSSLHNSHGYEHLQSYHSGSHRRASGRQLEAEVVMHGTETTISPHCRLHCWSLNSMRGIRGEGNDIGHEWAFPYQPLLLLPEQPRGRQQWHGNIIFPHLSPLWI